MVHTAMFDAWAAYDAKAVGTRLGGGLRRPVAERTTENASKAVSFAAYRVLRDLYPSLEAYLKDEMRKLGLDPEDAVLTVNTPSGIGNLTAAALLEYRHQDGSNQLGNEAGSAGTPYSDYTGYKPTNTPTEIVDPARWQPITFSTGATPGFLAPHWGQVKPFGLVKGDEFRPPAPFKEGSEAFMTEVREVIDINANLSDDEKAIAEYWADGPGSVTPPGHWQLFAQFVSQRDAHDLAQDVKMFFLVSNAVLDSSIAAWDVKRFYDTCRPWTAIHYRFKGQRIFGWGGPEKGKTLIFGEQWKPYQPLSFITPPFPEYVSGHSTFSAAAAEVLKRFTGSDTFNHGAVIEPGSSTIEPGVTPIARVRLAWPTFSTAADQAGMSRLYGGIHFRSGDQEGRKLGRKIGERVFERGMAFIEGKASVN